MPDCDWLVANVDQHGRKVDEVPIADVCWRRSRSRATQTRIADARKKDQDYFVSAFDRRKGRARDLFDGCARVGRGRREAHDDNQTPKLDS
jgi:hypothetical protein